MPWTNALYTYILLSMKLIMSCLILAATGLVPANRGTMSPESEVFVASSPCDGIPKWLLSIPENADCELIQWNLVLRRHPRTNHLGTFALHYTYGMSKPATVELMGGGTKGQKEGKWAILKDAANRTVYRLTPDKAGAALSFVKLDDNLLHLLDPQGRLMIGNAAWSYTLNRKQSLK